MQLFSEAISLGLIEAGAYSIVIVDGDSKPS